MICAKRCLVTPAEQRRRPTNHRETQRTTLQPTDIAHYRPGREGKANVTGYFPPAVKRQLRVLAAEEDTTIQALLGQALNDLFAKYGKPEVVPVEEQLRPS